MRTAGLFVDGSAVVFDGTAWFARVLRKDANGLSVGGGSGGGSVDDAAPFDFPEVYLTSQMAQTPVVLMAARNVPLASKLTSTIGSA